MDADGLGQSWLDDLRWLRRFRQGSRVVIPWRCPNRDEEAWVERHPQVPRFGDVTVAVAELDGRRWVVRERFWFGWPDPPRFVVFALADEAVWMARDFDAWPRAWREALREAWVGIDAG